MLIYQSGLTFFGLTPNYRLSVFNQIHDIVFYGKGGYTWETIYNMPIWLRNFTFNKINEFYESSNNQNKSDVVQESINTLKAAGNSKLITPPSYITKASKK
jgi:hypothetical protein